MMNPDNKGVSTRRRRGRPAEHRLGEDLSIIFALMREDSATTPADISRLLGIDEDRAGKVLENLRDGHVTDGQTTAPIVSTYVQGDDLDEYSRVPGSEVPKRVRLTHEQARACSDALDSLGFSHDEPLRRSLEESLFPVDYVAPQKPGQPTITDETRQTLLVCSRSIAQGRTVTKPDEGTARQTKGHANASAVTSGASRAEIAHGGTAEVKQPSVTFFYQGTNDDGERKRRLVPLSLRIVDGTWYVDGFDLDIRAARTFRADGMKSPKLEGKLESALVSDTEHPDFGTIRLSCEAQVKGRVLSLEGARVAGIKQDSGRILVDIPYFRRDWLPRQLLALGRSVRIEGEGPSETELIETMRAVAAEDLKAGKLKRP